MPLMPTNVSAGRADARSRVFPKQIYMGLGANQFHEVVVKPAPQLKSKGRCVECDAGLDIGNVNVEDEARHMATLSFELMSQWVDCGHWLREPKRSMAADYEPSSEFLKGIVNDEVPIGVAGFHAHNLQRLITLTRDTDLTNRDWATMLLSQTDISTPEVLAALLDAASDEDDVVRAEALLGLARRDRALALPFAKKALAHEYASMAVFEAVELIADHSLIPLLLPWTEESEDTWLDDCARRALSACERGAT